MLRLLPLLVLVTMLCQIGCHNESVPVLPPVARITARLHSVPDLKVQGIEFVEVPANEIAMFANLVTPANVCQQQQGIELRPDLHYLVADVVLEHSDGSKTNLTVRWTGHNPAAISLDGKKYYYGGTDAFPDGATRILRLLHEYDYQKQSPPMNVSPIVRITAKVFPFPKQQILGIESIEVPESERPKFANLISPKKPSVQEQGIKDKPDLYRHVADVVIEHQDKSKSQLSVRWTGNNPAAISLDGNKYFDGGGDAMTILRQLQEYHFQAQSKESE